MHNCSVDIRGRKVTMTISNHQDISLRNFAVLMTQQTRIELNCKNVYALIVSYLSIRPIHFHAISIAITFPLRDGLAGIYQYRMAIRNYHEYRLPTRNRLFCDSRMESCFLSGLLADLTTAMFGYVCAWHIDKGLLYETGPLVAGDYTSLYFRLKKIITSDIGWLEFGIAC